MAGSSFPRGWVLTSRGTGATPASVTAPASTGVVHVVDHVTAKYINEGAAAPPVEVINLVSAALGTIYLGDLDIATANASIDTIDEDVGMAGAPGEAVTVTFSGLAGNCIQMLVVQGHDI